MPKQQLNGPMVLATLWLQQLETMVGASGLLFHYSTHSSNIVNRNNLVVVSFTDSNGKTCNVDNQPQPAAYFTLVPALPNPTPSQPIMVLPTIPNFRDGNSPFPFPFN